MISDNDHRGEYSAPGIDDKRKGQQGLRPVRDIMEDGDGGMDDVKGETHLNTCPFNGRDESQRIILSHQWVRRHFINLIE